MTPFQALRKLKEFPMGFTHKGLYIESGDDGSPLVTDEGDIVFVTSDDPVTETSIWVSEDGEPAVGWEL